MAAPCIYTFKGKEYTYSEFRALLADGLLDKLKEDKVVDLTKETAITKTEQRIAEITEIQNRVNETLDKLFGGKGNLGGTDFRETTKMGMGIKEIVNTLFEAHKEVIKTKADLQNFITATIEKLREVKFFETNKGVSEKDVEKEIKDKFEAELSGGEKKEMLGITKEEILKEREEAGLSDIEREKISKDKINKEADEWIANGGNIEKLIKGLENQQELTPLKTAILSKYRAALKERNEKNPTPETIKQANRVDSVLLTEGSEAGRNLAFFKLLKQAKEDNLENFLLDAEAAQGFPLTQEQIDVETSAYKELKKKFEEYQKSVEEDKAKQAKDEAELGINKARAAAKKASKKSNEYYAEQRKAAINGAKEALKKIRETQTLQSSVPFAKQLNEIKTISPFVKDFVKTLVEQGTDKLDNIVNDTFAEFKDLVDGITKKHIIDIIAGVHDTPRETKPQKLNNILMLEREAELINKIANERKGIEKEKNNAIRSKKTDRIKELEKKLKDLQKENRKRFREEEAKDKDLTTLYDNLDKLSQDLAFEKDIEKQKEIATEIEQTRKKISDVNFEKNKQRQIKLQKEIDKLKQDIKDKKYLEEEKEKKKYIPSRKTQDLNDDVIALKKTIRIKRKAAMDAREGATGKVLKVAKEIAGIKRLGQTFLDWSVLARQLAKVTFNARHTDITKETIKAQMKSTFSAKNFDRIMDEIHKEPNYHEKVKDGIVFNDLNTGTEREINEDYPKSFLYNVPVIREALLSSNRAADAPLNVARNLLYDKFAENLKQQGIFRETHPKEYQDMANLVMNMTGRGKLIKQLEHSEWGKALGLTFYGTRLMASHFNTLNPANYFSASDIARGLKIKTEAEPKVNKAVRKEAIKNILGFATTVTAMGLALKAAGGDVSLDPDDSDFLQVRFGDKVYDISGGMSSYVRTALRLIEGVYARGAASAGFEDKDVAKAKANFGAESLKRFIRNKLAPNLSSGTNWYYDADTRGKEFDWSEFLEIYPMYIDDTKDAIKEDGLSALLTVLLPNLIGVGYGNYANRANYEVGRKKTTKSFPSYP